MYQSNPSPTPGRRAAPVTPMVQLASRNRQAQARRARLQDRMVLKRGSVWGWSF
jgi:hypothetical protein